MNNQTSKQKLTLWKVLSFIKTIILLYVCFYTLLFIILTIFNKSGFLEGLIFSTSDLVYILVPGKTVLDYLFLVFVTPLILIIPAYFIFNKINNHFFNRKL
jgi:hypothetical protein